MNKVIAVLSFVSLSCFASEPQSSYQFSVGVGHQYAGLLGAQLSYKSEFTKYYGSLGLIGISAGFETRFEENPKHSYGLVLGREQVQSEDGFIFATYNYHFNGFDQEGFVIGAGVGITREDEGGSWGNYGKTESSAALSLNLGYKF